MSLLVRRLRLVGGVIAVVLGGVAGVAAPAGAVGNGAVVQPVAYMAGSNAADQIRGIGVTDRVALVPRPEASLSTWSSVAQGWYHTVAVRSDGTLWAWGWNAFGQLGDGGAETSVATPEKIGTATDWVSVAAGGEHTVALRTDGTLWTWGWNGSGQLGLGKAGRKRVRPTQVGTATDWASIAARYDQTFAIRTDGTLWAWGDNNDGQLGDGTKYRRTSPVQIGTATDWASVAPGWYHTLAVRTDGTLWSWGNDELGQLGRSSVTYFDATPGQVGTATDWASAGAGSSHSLAVRTDGTLWAWGQDSYGQLGDGTAGGYRTSPEQIGVGTTWARVATSEEYTVAVRTDGTLWAWGKNLGGLGDGTMSQQLSPEQIGAGADWSAVTIGYYFTGALRTDGTLWTWGDNYYGQLGITHDDVITPLIAVTSRWSDMAAGSDWTVGIRPNGTLWTWGDNTYGQRGDGTTQFSVRAQIGTATTWVSAAAGADHALALRKDGTLWAWGHDNYGQLGTGIEDQHSPTQVGTAQNWAGVAAGDGFTLAVRTNGTLWAWGHNDLGQLGDGTSTTLRTHPEQIGTATNWASVSAGGDHAVAIRTDGTLWAWGNNSHGQLGDGTTTKQTTPEQIGTATNWTSADAGHAHTMAIRADGTLWAWGYNGNGQLGDGTTTDAHTPEQIGTATNWKHVDAGSEHTVAIRTDATLWAWGNNGVGELGDGTTIDVHVPEQIGTATTWTKLGHLGPTSADTIALAAG